MNYQKILNVAQSFIRLNDQQFVYMNAPTYTNRDMLYNKIFIAHYKHRKDSAWVVIFGSNDRYCSKYIGDDVNIIHGEVSVVDRISPSCVFVTPDCSIGIIKDERVMDTLKPLLDIMFNEIKKEGEDYAKSFRDTIKIYKK